MGEFKNVYSRNNTSLCLTCHNIRKKALNLEVIFTDRYFEPSFSWHLIFEWEDVFSQELGLELMDSRKVSAVTKYAGKAFNFASRTFHIPDDLLLSLFSIVDKVTCRKKGLNILLLNLKRRFYFAASRNTIPLVIDFWKTTNLVAFYKNYKNCPAVLIPDLEVYTYLKDNHCPLNIYHLPLSLPDKYKLSPDTKFNKTYDIIMPGRINIVLWHYLQDYLKKYPDVEFIHMVQKEDRLHYYNSNKTGIIGLCEDRDAYMRLLRSSKVAFYSTAGIDGGAETRTGGFNPVTPRFLEIVSAGCEVIARYPKNEDTDYFELEKICASVASYEEFECQLNKALNEKETPVQRNAAYLAKHYTSVRAAALKQILNQIK